MASTSSRVTTSIDASISSSEKNRLKYMAWRARLEIRALVDSSESINEPFKWSLARRNSSALTASCLMRWNSSTTQRINCSVVSRDVPAYTESTPESVYGDTSLKIG